MVSYWVSLYFDRAMFRNNPIFTANLAVAIDDHITQAFNDYGSSMELYDLELIDHKTTSDTIAVYLEICEDDSDLCIYGYEKNYEGGYLESTSFDNATLNAMGCAEEGVANEIRRMMDVAGVYVEVDPDSLPDDDDY